MELRGARFSRKIGVGASTCGLRVLAFKLLFCEAKPESEKRLVQKPKIGKLYYTLSG